MIVPQYWAEARLRKRIRQRQFTVKRFGWSDESLSAAQLHAEQRTFDAMAALADGKKVPRTEPKVPYNGADGVPIREQIISHINDAVITRNSYGALCINTPDILFADVDFEQEAGRSSYMLAALILIIVSITSGFFYHSWQVFITTLLVSMLLISSLAAMLFKFWLAMTGGAAKRAKKRICHFARHHPHWHLRLYRTPAGYRVLVMHDTFAPNDKLVTHFFKALKVDPIYARMCRKQACFRARVSPKPWRIGIHSHIKPRPGVWPVSAEKIPARQQWVRHYEHAARQYAACRFEQQLGSNIIHAKAEYIRSIHDDYSQAHKALSIA